MPTEGRSDWTFSEHDTTGFSPPNRLSHFAPRAPNIGWRSSQFCISTSKQFTSTVAGRIEAPRKHNKTRKCDEKQQRPPRFSHTLPHKNGQQLYQGQQRGGRPGQEPLLPRRAGHRHHPPQPGGARGVHLPGCQDQGHGDNPHPARRCGYTRRPPPGQEPPPLHRCPHGRTYPVTAGPDRVLQGRPAAAPLAAQGGCPAGPLPVALCRLPPANERQAQQHLPVERQDPRGHRYGRQRAVQCVVQGQGGGPPPGRLHSQPARHRTADGAARVHRGGTGRRNGGGGGAATAAAAARTRACARAQRLCAAARPRPPLPTARSLPGTAAAAVRPLPRSRRNAPGPHGVPCRRGLPWGRPRPRRAACTVRRQHAHAASRQGVSRTCGGGVARGHVQVSAGTEPEGMCRSGTVATEGQF